jgi:hypothetical protein
MSKKTTKRLNKLANGLEKVAQAIVSGMELVINDLISTRRKRSYIRYQSVPRQTRRGK